MSHPATLLKRYLTELNERIAKLDTKSNNDLEIISETIGKLDQKLDGNVQTANETLKRIESKVDDSIHTSSEAVNKLGQKLDDAVKTTNQAIGDLYREKLSVQEFREFVNLFNKILSENLPQPEKSIPQNLDPTLQNSQAEDNNSSQAETIAIFEPESVTPQNIEAEASEEEIKNNEKSIEESLDSKPSDVLGSSARILHAIDVVKGVLRP